jgi:hypothetical protein
MTHYEDKMEAIVKYTSTYRQLPGDPTKKHKPTLGGFLLHKVKNKGFMSDMLYYKTRPTSDLAAHIFAHPKIKDP